MALTTEESKQLVLLLLDTGDRFAGTFSLVRVLERVFHIFACTMLVKELEDDGMIITNTRDPLTGREMYLTPEGYQYLFEHKQELFLRMKKEYPDRIPFMKSWFDGFR